MQWCGSDFSWGGGGWGGGESNKHIYLQTHKIVIQSISNETFDPFVYGVYNYRKRCSTPTSSASSAPISLGTCSNVFEVGVPS